MLILLTMLGTTIVPLLIYSIRKSKSDFDVLSFFVFNRYRILAGFSLDAIIGLLMVYNPESVRPILTALNFSGEVSAGFVGFFIGSTLIALMGSSDLEGGGDDNN